MQETTLSLRAQEALRTIKALRRLPADTIKAQECVLNKAFKHLSIREQAAIAIALEEDKQQTTAEVQNRG